MRQPARVAPTPLFDRLISTESLTQNHMVSAALDFDGLRASVRTELERLLVSRTRRPRVDVDPNFRTTVDYGVHDHFSFDPDSDDDRKLLAVELEDLIAVFEPRLSSVRVRVFEPNGVDTSLRIRIDGALNFGSVKEPLTFHIAKRGDFLEVTK